MFTSLIRVAVKYDTKDNQLQGISYFPPVQKMHFCKGRVQKKNKNKKWKFPLWGLDPPPLEVEKYKVIFF